MSQPMEYYIDTDFQGQKIVLGEGQFGIVYKGVCRGSEVAIKVLKSNQITQSKKDEFLREINIMSSSQMKHPHLVLLLGACVEGRWAMVTEYMSRGSLEDILYKSNEKLNFSKKLQFAIDICNGMAWISGRDIKIIHRDIKPANILVDENWRCKIADFGLSLLIAKGVIKAGKRGIQGSALYMAPEALLEKENEISEKTDVYAFGLLLWEILKRKKVFKYYDDKGDLEYFTNAIVNEKVRPDVSNIHPLLENILQACWHENHECRPNFQRMLKKEWWDKDENLPSLPLVRVLIYLPKVFCKEAALLWLKAFGFETKVSIDKFVDMLCEFIEPNVPKDSKHRKFYVSCLSRLFHITDKIFSLSNFSKLIKWFGPVFIAENNNVLTRLCYIMGKNWFYGTTNALDAEGFLENERNGVPRPFLVRLNTGNKVGIDVSPFTISHFSEIGQYLHTRVYPEDNGYYIKLVNGQKIFASGFIDNLVIELGNREICISPCRSLNPFSILYSCSEEMGGMYISKYQNDDLCDGMSVDFKQ